MEINKIHKYQFAICINTDDSDLLTPLKVYKVLPDETAQKSYYLRIIDNECEDYLYPSSYFVFVEFSPEVEKVLLNVSKKEHEKVEQY